MPTSPSIVQCTNCDALKEAYNNVECTILDLMKNKWTNISYNTDLYFSQGLLNRLIRYKRVLYSRLYNPKYPCGDIDSQDIIKLVATHTYKKGNCSECLECFPPQSTTTTTTTTIAPDCCTVENVFATVEIAPIYYWGWKVDNIVLTEPEILLAPDFASFLPGADLTADFSGGAASPMFLWMAEPSTEPLKTKWQDIVQPINSGSIGTPLDLFDAPVISGSFRFYITVYPTQQTNPIKFEVI